VNKALLSALLVFLTAGVNAFSQSTGGFQKNDVPYSLEVVTPHIAWAKPLPGGPIKAFVVSPIQDGRDTAELMQRLDLDVTAVSIDRAWDVNCWGIGDYYGHETRGDRDDFQIVYGYVEKHLTGSDRYEVILLPGLNGWSRLTRPSRDAILRRVQEGAGLVLIHPFVGDVKGHPFKGDEPVGDTRIWDISPLVNCPDDTVGDGGYPILNQAAIGSGRWEPAEPHFITAGVSWDLLPATQTATRFYKYENKGRVLIRADRFPLLSVSAYGKGRVVALAYVEDGFLPEAPDPIEARIYWDYWEHYYALLGRSVLWAAGREASVSGASLTAGPGPGTPPLHLRLTSKTARDAQLEVIAGSELSDQKKVAKINRQLKAGENDLTVQADELAAVALQFGGKQSWSVIIRDSKTGASLDWATTTREVSKKASLVRVEAGSDVIREGETLVIGTQVTGELQGLKLRVSVMDDLGRIVWRGGGTTRGEKSFFAPLDHFLGKTAEIRAELVDPQGMVIDQVRSKPVMVAQKERRPREYQGLMSFGGARHYFRSIRQHLLRSVAMDTGFTWGAGVNNDLDLPRGYFGVYWYDRGPTDPEGLEKEIAEFQKSGDFGSLTYLTKKELFRRTGDKRFLARTPSLDDPHVLRLLADLSKTAARNKSRYNMDYYFVGDEGSLTSYTDPVDFCWGPDTLANFRTWLKGQYPSLDQLNRVWGASFADWSSVIPSTTEEARKSGRYAPWADHRTYMEMSFANAYKVVREAVVEGDRDGHIALSGTQVTNAYNGCDWYRLDQIIDHFLSYSGGNQWDLHRSFAKPGSMVGFWTGYGRSGSAVQHEIWTAALNNVLYPNLFWSYSVINPDFTWSKSGRDMGTAFSELRFKGIGKLLMEAERQGDGIAIHYSVPSVHAATILGYHSRRQDDDDEENQKVEEPSFPANRDGWAKLLTDLGLSYDFLAYAELEKGELDPSKYRVFILPMSIALSEKEIHSIRSFAERGGVVIADTAAGLMDEHCAWRSGATVQELFGVAVGSPEARKLAHLPPGTIRVADTGRNSGLGNLAGSLSPSEKGLHAAGSQAFAMIGDEPAVFDKRTGKGTLVYLNLMLDRYPRLRRESFGGSEYRELIGGMLGHLGMRPKVEVLDAAGKRLPQTAIARYRLGEDQFVAVLQEPTGVTTRFSADGVTKFEAPEAASGKQKVTIRLPGHSLVTDLRTGAELGETDQVQVELPSGEALVLGLSKVRPVLSVEGTRAGAPGDHLEFQVRAPGAGRRIVRCHFFGPDGKLLPLYARNIVLEEQATVVIPSAFNDSSGEYRLRVEDLSTGASAESQFVLR